MKNLKRYHKLFQDVVKEHQEGGPSNINSRILILDGLNTFIRVFSAVPALNDDGDHIGGVTGFLRSIAANIRLLKPTRVIICFDGKGGSKRRKKIYPEYKANRKERFADQTEQEAKEFEMFMAEFSDTLTLIKKKYPVFHFRGVEADDIAAYITQSAEYDDCWLISSDKDWDLLISDKVYRFSRLNLK